MWIGWACVVVLGGWVDYPTSITDFACCRDGSKLCQAGHLVIWRPFRIRFGRSLQVWPCLFAVRNTRCIQ